MMDFNHKHMAAGPTSGSKPVARGALWCAGWLLLPPPER